MSTTAIGSVAAQAAASPAPMLPAPRSTTGPWPATRLSAERARERLVAMPPVRTATGERGKRLRGIGLLLDWLTAMPGGTWQDRWLVSGADTAGADWRQVPNEWLGARGHPRWHQEALVEALPLAISADLLRPSLTWLVSGGGARGGLLVRNLAASRDRPGFSRLRDLCSGDGGVSKPTTTQCVYRCALILAAKGGTIQQITIGDVVELFAAEDRSRPDASGGRTTFYRVLRDLGVFGDEAPAMLRGLRTRGQQTPEELIDRYRLANRPIRDLLVDYLRERQPALDYTSLVSLSYYLGKRFWADIEAHHPGIDNLHLSRQVADDWKRRLRTFTKTKTLPAGERNAVTVERINYRECLTPVRALYLDLAHWAVEDPGRWGRWVVPCPVGEEEVNRRKAKRRLKARMDGTWLLISQ